MAQRRGNDAGPGRTDHGRRGGSRDQGNDPRQTDRCGSGALQPQLDDNERFIYFFDTPELELFESGIIARARRIVGSDHDSTIKFRPVVPDSVPAVVAQAQRLQDRGRRERQRCRQVRVADDAREQRAYQTRRRGQRSDCQPVHRAAAPVLAQHGKQENRLRQGRRHGANAHVAMEVSRPGAALAADGRALAARGRGANVRGLHQGPGRSGRGRDRRIHGVSRRSRGRARSTDSRPRRVGRSSTRPKSIADSRPSARSFWPANAAAETVDQEAVAQAAVADRKRRALQFLHDRSHDAGPGEDHLGTLGLKADDLSSRLGSKGRDSARFAGRPRLARSPIPE